MIIGKEKGIKLNVVYQPQVKLATGEIVGAEALVRPVGKDGGLRTSDYIAHLEADGGIERLDAYVFEKACKDLKTLLQEFPALRFCGNASRRTLEQDGFAENFFETTVKYGIPPSSIVAEITESYLDVDMSKLSNNVKELRKFGFSVAIDDFGKGCSCLSFLNDIACDSIKLDKFFLRNFDHPKTRVILDWTLELAYKLNLQTLAEGVETAEQAEYLRKRGCYLGQGYYFAKPMDIDELRNTLRKNRISIENFGGIV